MKTAPTEDHSPLHLLHRATQRVDEFFHAATHELDITPRQFLVLANIDKRGGLSQATLVGELIVRQWPTSSDLLLVKGCVRRRRKRKDARTYSVTLTAKGRAIMEQVEPIANEVIRRLLKCLSQHDARQLLRSLECIVQTPAR
jgi:DNA-binding MarR family transcriptional regulator